MSHLKLVSSITNSVPAEDPQPIVTKGVLTTEEDSGLWQPGIMVKWSLIPVGKLTSESGAIGYLKDVYP